MLNHFAVWSQVWQYALSPLVTSGALRRGFGVEQVLLAHGFAFSKMRLAVAMVVPRFLMERRIFKVFGLFMVCADVSSYSTFEAVTEAVTFIAKKINLAGIISGFRQTVGCIYSYFAGLIRCAMQ